MTTPMSWATYLPILFKSQFLTRIPSPQSDFSGQTIIITGSNTGLGLEAARQIVALKAAKVILAVRTPSKGQTAKADILTSTRATEDVVEVWPLDLCSHTSVREFGARVVGLERLDAVIQNAGVLSSFKVSYVGDDEAHIAVNTIAASLVGLLVLPKLRKTAKKFNTRTRLSFVGSDLQYIASVSEADAPEFASVLEALRDEKLARENIGNRYVCTYLVLCH